MKKNEKQLVITIPTTLMDDFQIKCTNNQETMSEVVKTFIREYVKNNKSVLVK